MRSTKAPFTRYNRLSNPFDNRFWQPVWQTAVSCIHYIRLSNRLHNPVWQPVEGQWLFVQHGCQTGCQTGLYNRFDNRVERTVCSFNTVVKPCLSNRLYNPVWQPVERTLLLVQHGLVVKSVVKPGCTTGLTTGCTTGLTTGCIV